MHIWAAFAPWSPANIFVSFLINQTFNSMQRRAGAAGQDLLEISPSNGELDDSENVMEGELLPVGLEGNEAD